MPAAPDPFIARRMRAQLHRHAPGVPGMAHGFIEGEWMKLKRFTVLCTALTLTGAALAPVANAQNDPVQGGHTAQFGPERSRDRLAYRGQRIEALVAEGLRKYAHLWSVPDDSQWPQALAMRAQFIEDADEEDEPDRGRHPQDGRRRVPPRPHRRGRHAGRGGVGTGRVQAPRSRR